MRSRKGDRSSSNNTQNLFAPKHGSAPVRESHRLRLGANQGGDVALIGSAWGLLGKGHENAASIDAAPESSSAPTRSGDTAVAVLELFA
jgi:hypothetical protein